MKITILGCGAFGTAIASLFEKKDVQTVIWSKFEKEIEKEQKNYPTIKITTSLQEACHLSDLIIIAIPINFIKDTILELKPYYQNQDILIASKGIDTKTHQFASEIILSILENAPIGIISGGSFAIDMKNKNVLGLTLATKHNTIKEKVKKYMESDIVKIQYIKDTIGLPICGAIKNVMAIGFGMLDGAKLPDSSKVLFLTNAIYEIKYLISTLQGEEDTIMTYAGIDDIMMTCTSSTSRNYTLGNLIGSNKSKEEIEKYKQETTIEGLGTAKAMYELAKNKHINLPLTNTIYQILYEEKNYLELINTLKNSTNNNL